MRKIIKFLKNLFYGDRLTPEEEREVISKIIKKIRES